MIAAKESSFCFPSFPALIHTKAFLILFYFFLFSFFSLDYVLYLGFDTLGLSPRFLIIYIPTSSGVSEQVSATEQWSEQCGASEWPSTYFHIHGCSAPLYNSPTSSTQFPSLHYSPPPFYSFKFAYPNLSLLSPIPKLFLQFPPPNFSTQFAHPNQ